MCQVFTNLSIFICVQPGYPLKRPIPSILVVFYIINQKLMIPRTDFHSGEFSNAFAYFVVSCLLVRWCYYPTWISNGVYFDLISIFIDSMGPFKTR